MNIDINSPEVQKAKAAFDACDKVNLTLSFEELFNFFSDESKTQSEIAEHGNVSRERIRQVYDTYFRPIFLKSGSERLAESSERTKRLRIDNLKDVFHGVLETVANEARRHGLTVENVIDPKALRISANAIFINGKKCNVHKITKATKTSAKSKTSYYKTTLTISTINLYDFEIFVIDLSDGLVKYFIIPTAVLSGLNNKQIYIPEVENNSTIRYWDYYANWKQFN